MSAGVLSFSRVYIQVNPYLGVWIGQMGAKSVAALVRKPIELSAWIRIPPIDSDEKDGEIRFS